VAHGGEFDAAGSRGGDDRLLVVVGWELDDGV
jgi:hypothetical protein